eukprot:CCRYP_005157-RA/>CCRYP_005157-RA protein AED:0.00 eAED:0.00 QI:176/1/0.5/1/1/1/2/0/53
MPIWKTYYLPVWERRRRNNNETIMNLLCGWRLISDLVQNEVLFLRRLKSVVEQ